jgi:hypothetical protein
MWVMSSEKDWPYITFYIGQVKIGHIHYAHRNPRWKAALVLNGCDISNHETVKDAMQAMHAALNAPRTEIENDIYDSKKYEE